MFPQKIFFQQLKHLWKDFMRLPIAPFVSNGWKMFHLNPDIHLFCWWVLCTNYQFFCLRPCPPWLLAWAWVQGRRRLKKRLISNQSIYWQVGSFMQNLSFSAGRRKWKKSEIAQLWPTVCHPMDYNLPEEPGMGFSRQEYWSGLPFPSPAGRRG